jgi:hypothetical protein
VNGKMISKITVCACFLLFCTPALAQWWNPFAPSDYEDCAEAAAKTAKTNQALKILIDSCASKFAGRRKVGGGYAYFDARQNRSFDIKGPNPTSDEMKHIDFEYADQIRADAISRAREAEAERTLQKEQAEAENRTQIYVAELARRNRIATNQLRANPDRLECLYPALDTCDDFDLTVTVKNTSKENVTSFVLGWTFISENTPSCPSTIQAKKREDVRLRPNDTTVLNIKGHDGPKSTKSRICVGVAGSEISP